MAYTETQLEAIRIFGKKELSGGCFAKWKGQENVIDIIAYRVGDTLGVVTNYKGNGMNVERIEEFSIDEYEVLGHEPHLEDVFRAAEEKMYMLWIDNTNKKITIVGDCDKCDKSPIEIKYSPSLPLLEQKEETLKQLISLFS